MQRKRLLMDRDQRLLAHSRKESIQTISEEKKLEIQNDDDSSSRHRVILEDNKKKTPFRVSPDDIRPYDILCGRDKATFNNIGNRRFRVSISLNIPSYDAAQTKAEKASVIKFVCSVLQHDVGVRFLRRQNKTKTEIEASPNDDTYYYVEISNSEARKKVGHALRDMSVARQQLIQRRQSATMNASIEFRGEDNGVKPNPMLTSLQVQRNLRTNELGELSGRKQDKANETGSIEDTLLEPLPQGADDLHLLPVNPQTLDTVGETRRITHQHPQPEQMNHPQDMIALLRKQQMQFWQRQQHLLQFLEQQVHHQQQQHQNGPLSSPKMDRAENSFVVPESQRNRRQRQGGEHESYFHSDYADDDTEPLQL